jgi:hypothetical protein
MTKTNRHFYAQYSPYGTTTLSEGMELAQFRTKEERDEWVERMNGYADKDEWEAVTLREVSHRFDPKAFGTDREREYRLAKTCHNRPVFYIETRPNYRF